MESIDRQRHLNTVRMAPPSQFGTQGGSDGRLTRTVGLSGDEQPRAKLCRVQIEEVVVAFDPPT